jgi:hypothetical protein
MTTITTSDFHILLFAAIAWGRVDVSCLPRTGNPWRADQWELPTIRKLNNTNTLERSLTQQERFTLHVF